jgi:hypothetical protein
MAAENTWRNWISGARLPTQSTPFSVQDAFLWLAGEPGALIARSSFGRPPRPALPEIGLSGRISLAGGKVVEARGLAVILRRGSSFNQSHSER